MLSPPFYYMLQLQTFDLSIFEVKNEMVNLTKICQYFNKRIDVWLKSQATQRFLEAYSTITPNGGIAIIKGGNGEQGTFGDRRVALKLAEWISVEFELFTNQKLDELFQTGKTQLKTQTPLELLKLAVVELEAKEKENQQLALANTELATRDLEVKTEKDYKWKVKVIKDDLGKMINYYVRKHFLPFANNSYSLAHTKAKKEYKAISGVDLPAHISLASTEAKREYLNWLSRI